MGALTLTLENRQSDLPISEESVRRLASLFFEKERERVDELSVSFVSLEESAHLHALYFDDPTPTDCMTFPIDAVDSGEYRLLGEVVICPKVAQQHVEEEGGDLYEEVSLYLVHGLLHLLGHEDREEAGRQRMREAEADHLEHLRKKKALLT